VYLDDEVAVKPTNNRELRPTNDKARRQDFRQSYGVRLVLDDAVK
jgi:hypothetical protein